MKKTILSILMILLLLNLVYAQSEELSNPGTLPDSAFYGLKKAFEGLGNAFTFGETAKTARALKLAERRLAEAEAMANKGESEFVDELSEEYENQINKANEIASLAKEASDKEKLAELVSMATLQHLTVLDEVQERVPEQARERIVAARERSIRGNQEALKTLARENPEKSAEISIEAAESRVNKMQEFAEEGDEEKVAEAVEEYEKYAQFGEEISTTAEQAGKDPSKANELVATATSSHITVLQDVLEKVPEQARASIQRAIENSQRSRDSAVSALEERGLSVPEEAKGKDSGEIEVEIPESGEQTEQEVSQGETQDGLA